MLLDKYSNEQVIRIIQSNHGRTSFPKCEDRAYWDSIPDGLKTYLIYEGEKYIGYQWPNLTAIDFIDYSRTGNRGYNDKQTERRKVLSILVVAECIEDKNRFVDDIINGIWAICEETAWNTPAHNWCKVPGQDYPDSLPLPQVQDPIIELFAAEIASALSWTAFILKEKLDNVSKLIYQRVEHELERRILTPFLKDDTISWMGLIDTTAVLHNWTPWIISNLLVGFTNIVSDIDTKSKLIIKSMKIIDRFVKTFPEDGGCDEGPSYWQRSAGCLFESLELLYVFSKGEIDVFDTSIIKEMGKFIVRSHIDYNSFVAFADGQSKLASLSPPGMVFLYGERIHNKDMMDLAAYFHHLTKNNDWVNEINLYNLGRLLRNIDKYKIMDEYICNPPYLKDVWLDQTQFFVARENEGVRKGLFLAAKGGHNNESHNHNDVGHFIIYNNGQPFIIDPGVGAYTKDTFEAKLRYTIWTMQSSFHNLPTVNGVMQREGCEFKASNVKYHKDEEFAQLSMDIHSAYPNEANIEFWNRNIIMRRCSKSLPGGEEDLPAQIEIEDKFMMKSETDNIFLTLMSAHEPVLIGPEIILLKDSQKNAVTIEFDHDLSFEYDAIELIEKGQKATFGEHIYRIRLMLNKSINAAKWKTIIKAV